MASDLRDRFQVNPALGQARDQRAPPAVRGRAGASHGLGPPASRRKSPRAGPSGAAGGPTSGREARRRSGALGSGLVCRTRGRASGPAPGNADRAADRRRRDLRSHSTCLE